MTIQSAINTIFQNVGIGYGDFFLLLAIMVSVLFMIASFRLGLAILLIFDALLFIIYTLLGIPNYNAIIALLFTGAIFASSLFWTGDENVR